MWEGGKKVLARATPRFTAVELPEEYVLRKAPLRLPAMAHEDAMAAMALRRAAPVRLMQQTWCGATAAKANQGLLGSRWNSSLHHASRLHSTLQACHLRLLVRRAMRPPRCGCLAIRQLLPCFQVMERLPVRLIAFNAVAGAFGCWVCWHWAAARLR